MHYYTVNTLYVLCITRTIATETRVKKQRPGFHRTITIEIINKSTIMRVRKTVDSWKIAMKTHYKHTHNPPPHPTPHKQRSTGNNDAISVTTIYSYYTSL